MMAQTIRVIPAVAVLIAPCAVGAADRGSSWQEEFGISKCNLLTTGRNPYFVLEPGFELVLSGKDTKIQITVLEETKTVDGVATRVVEEKQWEKGKLHAIARNYFAICEQTKDVFYFGEDVDYYENDKVINHEGSWQAGNGNRPGLMMPGAPKAKMKFYQELAPKVAMDRAEIISLEQTCNTPAGTFSRCMKVKESSAIELTLSEYKYYAPGIGLVADENVKLIKYGFKKD